MPLKYETDHESLFQRAFAVQYNAKKMKKLEKEYQVIRKEEQEEQIEIRVGSSNVPIDRFDDVVFL